MHSRYSAFILLLMVVMMAACAPIAENPLQSAATETMESVVASVQRTAEAVTSSTAASAQTQIQIREMQVDPPGYEFDTPMQYIQVYATAGRVDTVPVYWEEQLLYSMECFAIGQDAGIMAGYSGLRRGYFEDMVTLFPDPVVRDIGDYVYIYYDTENDTRLYVFYSKGKNNCWYTDGFPVIMKKPLSYADFVKLNPGDTLDLVEAIDPIVPLYMPVFNLYTDEALKGMEDRSGCFQTIHLLTDGILRINYDKIDGEYVITGIIYREDFILDGLNGQTCYRIYEEDYKG